MRDHGNDPIKRSPTSPARSYQPHGGEYFRMRARTLSFFSRCRRSHVRVVRRRPPPCLPLMTPTRRSRRRALRTGSIPAGKTLIIFEAPLALSLPSRFCEGFVIRPNRARLKCRQQLPQSAVRPIGRGPADLHHRAAWRHLCAQARTDQAVCGGLFAHTS